MKVVFFLCAFLFSQFIHAQGFDLEKGEFKKLSPLRSNDLIIADNARLEDNEIPPKAEINPSEQLGKYCTENKKAFALNRSKESYSYFRWRGGFFLHKQNCNNGNEKLFYIKAREMKFQYKIKF